MKKIKFKAIKYAILMIVIFLLTLLFARILSITSRLLAIEMPLKSFASWYWLFFYFLNSIFALILFLDCRKEIKNFIVIPLLSIFAPVVAVMFYFVAILLETRKQSQ